MGGLPGPRQHPFRLGITLSSRLWLPGAFRPLAFASWTFLLPLELPATLTSAVLTTVRFHGGYHVPHHRAATGVGAFYTPGSWCPCLGACVNPRPLQTTVASCLLTQHCRRYQSSCPATSIYEASTKIHRCSPVQSFPGLGTVDD